MSELLARHGAVIPNWVGISYDEPIQIVSGKGCRVTDSQGSSYLDFFAGILTNMLGYDVPEVRDAVERQIATGVVHTSTLYLIRNQIELDEKIVKLSGIPNAKGFFTNSGADANEAALLAALTARRTNHMLVAYMASRSQHLPSAPPLAPEGTYLHAPAVNPGTEPTI